MPDLITFLIDIVILIILIFGIRLFRTPQGARYGNLTAALSIILAVAVTLQRNGLAQPKFFVLAVIIGSLFGWWIAIRTDMIQIPAMVAFQHGAGGVAVSLVSFIELMRTVGSPVSPIGELSGIIGLVLGAATFAGSMLAAGKLSNRLRPAPSIFRYHNLYLTVLLVIIILLAALTFRIDKLSLTIGLLWFIVLLSLMLGLLFAMRIGGADMPVLISFLNATAGLAAAFCGIIIQNRLLIACGATVAASGSILTHVMCKAMNRRLVNVFIGIKKGDKIISEPSEGTLSTVKDKSSGYIPVNNKSPSESALEALISSRNMVIIPGYGMALAHAQFKVVELMVLLEKMGKIVKFAIHPVAGRMPGHMNVLLAEADVPYDKLFEMDDINLELPETDLVLIIGACDVVNPAATETEGTPISGMPILNAHLAKQVIVFNLDEKPGYSGVENTLYKDPKVIMLLGDASKTLQDLNSELFSKHKT
ncbi:MAG: NAD(P)(+) transhydrogenase (Re/Si-specific) subunit beta [Desulfobacterales bacterium]|nr:NAD(P)(+) transhydrogenase (Re/Si-specific) subunit beta [Desulfobacterales bacterium]